MEAFHLKKRHRMRKKDIVKVNQRFEDRLGISLQTMELDSADFGGQTVYIVGGEVVAMEIGDEPFLTLKGLLKYQPAKSHVVVDEGAISFLYNGADVMAPGVVDADPDIDTGDIVWVKEIKYGRPLVVGRALMQGKEMVESEQGKAVETIHHLNDPLWNVEV